MPHPILLYDGVCGLCNRLVQFILLRDRARPDRDPVFRFASLQSPFAAPILARHNINPSALDTVCLVLNYNAPQESVLLRFDAVLFVFRQLGGVWRFSAFFFQLLPRSLRDWKYGVVARNRYRIFGRYETCPVPPPENRERFLDQ
jgi:predicted DCC family thiol-disulfide oxidoreductase YuxK